jgi:hypothetical protein
MTMRRTSKRKLTEEALQEIERTLESSLSRVQPRQEFVEKLQNRLTTPAAVMLEQPSGTPGLVLVIVAGGMFIGALLIWVLHRLRG